MSAVALTSPILRTKLYPPRLPEIIVRERLIGELERQRSAKLIAIIAGAGYGKSTLAVEFMHRLGSPFVWYQLEDTDSDLSVFISYLAAGIREIYSEFGRGKLPHPDSAVDTMEPGGDTLSSFIWALDDLIGEELFVVLDDFHTVNESAQITEAMDFLLSHMLPNLHFIILSRSAPSLDLSNLRVRRESLELSENDLRFTLEETASLFTEVLGMPMSDGDVAALSEFTEGWASGLILFYLATKGGDGDRISAALKELDVLPSAMSDYLSRAVYGNQSREVRDFLARTSILSRMNPAFCAELLGMAEARELFSRLTGERLFTIPLDERGEWYRYHHCLGTFLQATLREDYPPAEVADLHLKAASLWEREGEPEQALFHYMEAQDYEKAADVLEDMAGELLHDNRISFLYREIARLPGDVQRKHPALMLHDTQVAALLGDYGRVLDSAGAAAAGFEEMGDDERRALSLFRVAEGLINMGRELEAIEMSRKAREAMPPGSPHRYEAMGFEGYNYVSNGKAEEADPLLQEAFSHVKEIEDVELKIRVLAWCGIAFCLLGRLGKSGEACMEADKIVARAGFKVAMLPAFYFLGSVSLALIDRAEEAAELAGRAVDAGEQQGLVPMIFFNRAARAVARAYLGERERAREDAAAAASMCKEYETIPYVGSVEFYIGLTYVLIGDNATALQHLKKAEEMLANYGAGDARHFARVLIDAISLQDLGLQKAMQETQEIIEVSTLGGSRSTAYSILFTLELTAGRQDEAEEVLAAYVDEFGEDIILRLYSTGVEHLLPFFTDLFSQGKYLAFMQRLFTTGGTSSTPYLQKLSKGGDAETAAKAMALLDCISRKAAEPLRVRLLGSCEVSLGDLVLHSQDWKSKKALAVFKYLAANRDRGLIPRDVLMELLWPETAPESAAKNLNAALTSLRKTLEPQAGRGMSSYLVTSADALRLELGNGGWTDLELFRAKLQEAGKARTAGDFDLYFLALHEAADLYRGQFLAEDLYEDWCAKERDALASSYLGVMVDAATEHLRRGEGQEALAHLEEALAQDPGREELYRKQMIVCSRMGNRAGVEQAFRSCDRYLKDNYDVPPSPETLELYGRLREQ
ncbi:MAG: hypothetical protein JW854_02795 [Actinobacteria bacterium]|nr:hypothetical protein [Actinomycetota bacterium]